MGKVKRGNK